MWQGFRTNCPNSSSNSNNNNNNNNNQCWGGGSPCRIFLYLRGVIRPQWWWVREKSLKLNKKIVPKSTVMIDHYRSLLESILSPFVSFLSSSSAMAPTAPSPSDRPR